MKLAEALAPELPPDRAEEVVDEYLDLYNGFYLETMRKKLGLLKKDEPEDEILITELLQTMHNTGGILVDDHYISASRAATISHFLCTFTVTKRMKNYHISKERNPQNTSVGRGGNSLEQKQKVI